MTTGAVILSKDEDFPIRAQQAAVSPILIWLRVGNTSNHALQLWLMPQLPQILTFIEQSARVLEIR